MLGLRSRLGRTERPRERMDPFLLVPPRLPLESAVESLSELRCYGEMDDTG